MGGEGGRWEEGGGGGNLATVLRKEEDSKLFESVAYVRERGKLLGRQRGKFTYASSFSLGKERRNRRMFCSLIICSGEVAQEGKKESCHDIILVQGYSRRSLFRRKSTERGHVA